MTAPPGVRRVRPDRGAPPWTGALVVLATLVVVAGVVVGARALLVPRTPLQVDAPAPLVTCTDVVPTVDAPTSSVQLYECPDAFDGRRVRVVGEAIGHVLQRDGFAWLQLNDDVYALEVGPVELHHTPLGPNSSVAVAVPDDLELDVDDLGGSRHRGDRVEVVGTFRVAEPLDGGGVAIVADEARVVASGGPVVAPPATSQRVAAVVLLLVTAIAGAPLVRRRR